MAQDKEKTLSEEQIQEALNELKTQHFINNMLYREELNDPSYTDDKDIIKKRINDIKDYIQELNISESFKNNMLNNEYFLSILGRIDLINDEYLDKERINELATDFDRINTFFNGFKTLEEGLDAYELYGIVDKDNEGYYKLDDNITDTIIKENDLYIKGDKSDVKEFIFNTWENQKELITNDTLNKSSEQQNGLSFKKCLFCEEYIKRSNIKATCEYLGISRNTAYLWLKESDVQAYLKSRQDEIKEDTNQVFKDTYNACFKELNKMVTSDYMQNTDKIKAIDTFLKHYENIERLKQPLTTYED